MAKYDELKREQARARAAGRYFGIGLALAVDPSVSNMGYVATALDPQFRAKPEYLRSREPSTRRPSRSTRSAG